MPPSYTGLEPIAAIATPPGESALAVIRVSGEGAVGLLAPLFSRPRALCAAAGNVAVYGWMVDKSGRKIDEVLVTVYRMPASYTGEEGADICCHGGHAAPAAILRLLTQGGFRQALRGEFSYRAFLNGKIDLSRAEAVMEIVGAQSDGARANSVRRLAGSLEAEINRIKTMLMEVITAVELLLDYSEVDGVGLDTSSPDTDGLDTAIDTGGLPAKESALCALSRLDTLLGLYQTERLEREGALVVLAGRPNAGKSSLFNLLLREERAIVTEIPGTTRDWVEGRLDLDGIPIRLVDTAGLHNTENPVEKLGIERSLDLIAHADLVLYVIDGESVVSSQLPEDGCQVLAGISGKQGSGVGGQGAGASARDMVPNADSSVSSEISAKTLNPDPRPPTPESRNPKSEIRNLSTPMLYLWNKSDTSPMPSGFSVDGRPCFEVSAKTGNGLADVIAAAAAALKQLSVNGFQLPVNSFQFSDVSCQSGASTSNTLPNADSADSPGISNRKLTTDNRQPTPALRPPTPDPQNLKSEIRNPKSDYRLADGAPCPGTERQRALLEEARRSLQEAIDLSETGATLDLVAPPLRACLDALGEITGEVTTAAILDTMFNTFCVGK